MRKVMGYDNDGPTSESSVRPAARWTGPASGKFGDTAYGLGDAYLILDQSLTAAAAIRKLREILQRGGGYVTGRRARLRTEDEIFIKTVMKKRSP